MTSDADVAEVGRDGNGGDRPDSDAPAPRTNRHRIARAVGAVGRLMMTTGVVILLLVAYQLWGTNLQTNRSQDELADEYAELVAEPPPEASTTTSTVGPPTTTPAQTAPASLAPPGVGEVIGSFTIPAIGRTTPYYAVEGDGIDQLKRGAAHYPGTPLPGQAGNAAVAGHRTTYGAPLHDVDDLVAGDQIFWTTPQGEFTYEVTEVKIVGPRDVSVIQPQNATPEDPVGDDMLTLTACHPKFSAAQRIIVHAKLVGNPVEKLPGQDQAAAAALDALGQSGNANTIDDFATEPALRFPGAWWGLLCIGLWILTRVSAHLLRKHRKPWILAYVVGTPVCLVVLYLFFESFSYEGFARSVGLTI